MIRTEESKRQWILAEAAKDWETMDKIEAEWDRLLEADSADATEAEEAEEIWEGEFLPEWTDADEAALEEWEEERRRKLSEANEY